MIKTNLPVLIVHNIVLFPCSEIKIEINDINDRKVISLAESYFNNYIFIVCPNDDNMTNLPNIGVIAQIKFKIDMPNGMVKVSLKGINRSQVCNYNQEKEVIDANVTNVNLPGISPTEELANVRVLKNLFIEYIDNKKSIGNSVLSQIDEVNNADNLTDIIASFMSLSYIRQMNYLNEIDPLKRVTMLIDDLHYELSLIEYEASLDEIVESNLDKNQKEFILKEKLKVINEELGVDENVEIQKLTGLKDNLDCPDYITKRLEEEIERYKLCNNNSPEIGVLRNYIDTLLSLPWNKSTKDNNDISSIKETLESSHYGLSEAKNRIIEYMATRKHTKSKSNPIICLVGPPGIGKTSLAKAISVALKRKCVKISVGGINDEAEITGHRRAYVGAAPGKIITGLRRIGVNNPVFIIDEIDKMTKDIKGDPASSLLEVLDKEQNSKFVDHFVEEEFDLSKVMFILTANYIDKIPDELKDRLEIIELSSYTVLEKLNIAKNYILKSLMKIYNLKEDEFSLSDETILKLINNYTRESGVRELERLIEKLCRKYICCKMINNVSLNIDDNIVNLLGREKYSYQDNYPNSVGVINGLAYNPLGGEIVKIESALYDGTGKIDYSGQLGEMMQESICLSFAYLKSHFKDFGITIDSFKKNDFHVHLPGCSTKKDGPSAGVCVVTSLISLLKNIPISNNISMTGEISLTGKVLKIGGLKEKLIAAMANNIDTIYIPKDNENDVLDLDEMYREKIKIIFVEDYLDIYNDLFAKK